MASRTNDPRHQFAHFEIGELLSRMAGGVTESDADASAALASSGAARRIAVRLLTGAGGSGNHAAKLTGSGGSGNLAAYSPGLGVTSGVISMGGPSSSSSLGGRSIGAAPAGGGGSPDSLAGWASNPKESRRKLPQKAFSESVERAASCGPSRRTGQAGTWGKCDELMADWSGPVGECGSAHEAEAAGAEAEVAPRRGAQAQGKQREGRSAQRGPSSAPQERQQEPSLGNRLETLGLMEREIPRAYSDGNAPLALHLSRTGSGVDHPRAIAAQREKGRGGGGSPAGGAGAGISRTSSSMSVGGDEVRRLENEIAVLRRQLVTVSQAKNAFAGNASGSASGSAQSRAYQHSGPQGEARSPEWQSIAMEVVELRGQLNELTETNGRITELLEMRTHELVETKEELKTAKEERDALAREMEALLESLSASPPADVASNPGINSPRQQQQMQQRLQQAEEESHRLQLLLETTMAERDMAVRLAAATGRLPAGLIPSTAITRSPSEEASGSPRMRFTPLDVRFRNSNLSSCSNSPSAATSSPPMALFSPSMGSYSPSASFSPSGNSFSPSSSMFSPSGSLTTSPSCLSPATRYAPSQFRSHSESGSGKGTDTTAKSWLGAEPAGQPRRGMMRSSSRGLVTAAAPNTEQGSPARRGDWRAAIEEVHVGKGNLRRTATAGGAIDARQVAETRASMSMSRPGSADIGALVERRGAHSPANRVVEKGVKKGELKGILSRKSKQVRWSYDFDQEGGL